MATRIYFPSNTSIPAGLSNPTVGTWTETTGFVRRGAVTSRVSSAMTDKTQARTASAANNTWLDTQYSIGPLAGQTFGATTVKGTIRALESAANDNVDAMRLLIRPVAPDGTTFRTTIYGPTNGTVAEFNTALRAKRLATGGATTSSTITEGDYLVIEIGATATTGGVSISTTINYGDNSATDLGDNETDTAANNPFIEFAANMKFLQRGFGQAQASIKAFGVKGFGQAQGSIKAFNIVGLGQAQSSIKQTYPLKPYDRTVLNDLPVVYWPLGETKDFPQDIVSTADVTAKNGTPTYGVSGPLSGDSDTGITFDGVNESFTIPNNTILDFSNGPMSIEILIKRGALSGSTVMQLVGRGINGWAIGFSNNTDGDKFYFGKQNVGQIVRESGSSTDLTNWHHYVATHNGAGAGNNKVYKDGIDVSAFNADQTIVDVTATIEIGSNTTNGWAFNGSLAKIAVYNYILTPEQVTEHFEAISVTAIGPYGQAQSNIKATYRGYGQAAAQINANNTVRFRQKRDGVGDPASIGFSIQTLPMTFPTSIGILELSLSHILTDDISVSGLGYTWVKITDILQGVTTSQIWTTTETTDASNTSIVSINWTGVQTSGSGKFYELTNVDKTYKIFTTNSGTSEQVLSTGSAGTILGINGVTTAEEGAFQEAAVATFAVGGGGSQGVINSLSNGFTNDSPFNADTEVFGSSGGEETHQWLEFVETSIDLDGPVSEWASSIIGLRQIPYPTGQAQAYIDNGSKKVFGQAQADIKQTYRGYAQAQADIKQVYQVYAQVQSDIKQTYRSYAQSQAQIKQTYQAYAQSQADIKQTYQSYAQAQADIKQTYRGYAQAQSDIKQIYQVYAQAQVDIKQTYQGYAQSQADIKATSNGFAQAQASIKQTYNAFAQSQADIKQTYRGYAQAQVYIRVTDIEGFAQAQADIKQIYRGYAQSQADIKQTYNGFGQAQADIKQVYFGFAQANVDIKATVNAFAQAQAGIKSTYQSYGQAQADIKAITNAYSQAQADIKTTYQAYGQAQADIKVTTNVHAQAQAQIKQTYQVYGQSQAKINAFGVNTFAQAQADILFVGDEKFAQAQAKINSFGFGQYGQTQAHIVVTNIEGFGQSQADIKQTYNGFAQAQAKINSFGVQKYGQANAYILGAIQVFAQTQADIKAVGRGFGQSNADIKAISRGYGQAQADTKVTTNRFAQAQAYIKVTDIESFAQSQADIKATYQGYGQSQADIKTTYRGYGQACADIKQTYRGYAQAQTLIVTTRQVFAQANADIKATSTVCGQAQGNIKRTEQGYGQAQSDIKQTYRGYAQAQAQIILNQFVVAQSQAYIKLINNSFGQAQGHIEQTYNQHAQAQAYITTGNVVCAQAQAQIKISSSAYGQAQTLITSTIVRFAQAQALILTTVNVSGQAQATIVKAAAYGQAQAFIHQPHTLANVEISDERSMFSSVSDEAEFESELDDNGEDIEVIDIVDFTVTLIDEHTVIIVLTDSAY